LLKKVTIKDFRVERLARLLTEYSVELKPRAGVKKAISCYETHQPAFLISFNILWEG
jgi:hypothetical protein